MLIADPTRYDTPESKVAQPDMSNEWAPFKYELWGVYAEAVARWTLATGQTPPAPIQDNRNGNSQLTAEFAAWMMGLPAGYLDDPEVGLSRSEIIRLAGNWVVPQAALVAYSLILSSHGLSVGKDNDATA